MIENMCGVRRNQVRMRSSLWNGLNEKLRKKRSGALFAPRKIDFDSMNRSKSSFDGIKNTKVFKKKLVFNHSI